MLRTVAISILLFISFNAIAATRYWVAAGTSNWNNTANWSTSSGGAGGASVPGASDYARFDGNGTGDCNIDVNVSVIDIDIAAGYSGTITQTSTYTITCSSDCTWSGGTFAGGSGSININGGNSLTISGTDVTSTSGTLTTTYQFTLSSGSFNQNGGNVVTDGNMTLSGGTYTGGSGSVTINGGYSFNVSGATVTGPSGGITASYQFTLSSGSFNQNGGDIVTNGNVTLSGGTFTGTSGNITVTGGYSFKAQGATVTAPSGTIEADYIFYLTGGSFAHNNGTVIVNDGWSFTGFSGNPAFYNLTFDDNGSQSYSVPGGVTVIVDGTLTIAGGINAVDVTGTAVEVKGDISVTNSSSSSDFTAPLTLNGTGAQSIDFNDHTVSTLTINNSYATSPQITLTGKLNISSGATFTDGIMLTTATNLLTFKDNATVSGASNNSYADGPVKKIGNDNFTFPVGDNDKYMGAGITFVSGSSTSDAFTAQYFSTAYSDVSTFGTGVTNVSQNEYWQLDKNAGTPTMKVTLHNNGTSGIDGGDEANIIVTKWDGAEWIDIGASGNTGDYSSGTWTSNNITSFSPFGFGTGAGGGSPLPIELIDFEAEFAEGIVKLNWQTASETDNDYFTVERSADAKNFEMVTKVPGAGNSTETQSYSATDNYPLQGVSYYRLKQTDDDGSFEYTDLVAVKNDHSLKDFGVKMSPNPTEGYIKLDISGASNNSVAIFIYNTYGEELYVQNLFVNGSTSVVADLSGELPRGTYIVTAECGNKLWSEKLVVR